MAQRRMFSLKIVGSDDFLEMPVSARELYFQLSMYADDDGFISPRKIMRMIGAGGDDLKMLVGKRFVLPFESGVVVIKHWRVNNQLRADRYTQTDYTDQKKTLFIKESGAYSDKEGTPLLEADKRWQPNGNQMEPQYSIGKYSIDNNNPLKEKKSKYRSKFSGKPMYQDGAGWHVIMGHNDIREGNAKDAEPI